MHQPQLGSTDSTPNPLAGPDDLAMRAIEQSFAYNWAILRITTECMVPEAVEDEVGDPWYDLASLEEPDMDVSCEVAYLDSRNLLLRHPEHPSWVRLCDEAEPVMGLVQ